MKTLNDIVVEAAREGGLDGLTLYRTADGWQANVRRKGGSGWRVEIDADPVVALLRALGVSEKTTDMDIFG